MQDDNTCKRKRLLYITVKPVPYRTLFFNELANTCDLTVLYESVNPGARNAKWQQSETLNHKAFFLKESCGNSVFAFLKMMQIIVMGGVERDCRRVLELEDGAARCASYEAVRHSLYVEFGW